MNISINLFVRYLTKTPKKFLANYKSERKWRKMSLRFSLFTESEIFARASPAARESGEDSGWPRPPSRQRAPSERPRLLSLFFLRPLVGPCSRASPCAQLVFTPLVCALVPIRRAHPALVAPFFIRAEQARSCSRSFALSFLLLSLSLSLHSPSLHAVAARCAPCFLHSTRGSGVWERARPASRLGFIALVP